MTECHPDVMFFCQLLQAALNQVVNKVSTCFSIRPTRRETPLFLYVLFKSALRLRKHVSAFIYLFILDMCDKNVLMFCMELINKRMYVCFKYTRNIGTIFLKQVIYMNRCMEFRKSCSSYFVCSCNLNQVRCQYKNTDMNFNRLKPIVPTSIQCNINVLQQFQPNQNTLYTMFGKDCLLLVKCRNDFQNVIIKSLTSNK